VTESERRYRTISSTSRLTPDEVAGRSFPTAFRGISESDVRAFLKRVADELSAVRNREQELTSTIDELEARLRSPRPLDEQELLEALGEETTRLLRSAREAAIDIRGKAEERATRLVHDAHEESERVRQQAHEVLGEKTQEAESVARGLLEEAEQRATDLMRVADERAGEVRSTADRYAQELRARVERESEIEIAGARERGLALLEEATSLRDRVIDDLGRRRELLSGQLEELRTGRDQLLDAYRIVKRTFLEATEALAQVEARATAGRPAGGSDAADLTDALAAEAEAARVAGLEPDAAAATEPGSAEPEVAAAADEPEPEGGDDTGAANLADVDDLFARLRAGAQAAAESHEAASPAADAPAPDEPRDAEPPDAAAVVDIRVEPDHRSANGSEQGAETDKAADEVPAWLSRRDEALAPLRVALVRQVKLAIGNEQNEVLDKVRRHRGRVVATAALPDVDAQVEAWTAVVSSAASDAYRLARADAMNGDTEDGGHAAPDDLAPALARAMVEPLRDRLVATIDGGHEPGETAVQVAERIGARYREWKNRSAESSSDDALFSAYSRGHYDAAPDGALLTWRVPPDGCCVDCADNALEPTRKGEGFPTGQPYPPAHPGCRCAVTVDASAAARGGTESIDAESTSSS
jgi:DivIVA domain-containing protein